MIYQNSQNGNTQNQFSKAVKELQIGKLLRKSNITKSCGISAYEVFQFLLLLAARVTSVFDSLTRPERRKILVLDDSVIKRNRSKKVELLARVYDHVEHKFQKGFTLLTLGWSDGYSFIPIGFNMLSSTAKNNRYQEVSDNIDHRTNGYKACKESMLKKTEAAVLLVQRALDAGIKADYILMDTWFTTEPMLKDLLKTGIDVKRWVLIICEDFVKP